MSKAKQKNVQCSIYFPPDVLQRLQADMSLSERKLSGEVVYMLRRLWSIRDQHNADAIKMAEEHEATEGQDSQPQS